jgi:hypothetical protein
MSIVSILYLVYQVWLFCVGIIGMLSAIKQHFVLSQLVHDYWTVKWLLLFQEFLFWFGFFSVLQFVGGLVVSSIANIINFPFSLHTLDIYVENLCQKEKFDRQECEFGTHYWRNASLFFHTTCLLSETNLYCLQSIQYCKVVGDYCFFYISTVLCMSFVVNYQKKEFQNNKNKQTNKQTNKQYLDRWFVYWVALSLPWSWKNVRLVIVKLIVVYLQRLNSLLYWTHQLYQQKLKVKK